MARQTNVRHLPRNDNLPPPIEVVIAEQRRKDWRGFWWWLAVYLSFIAIAFFLAECASR